VRLKAPFVRLGGRWIACDQDAIKRALYYFKKRSEKGRDEVIQAVKKIRTEPEAPGKPGTPVVQSGFLPSGIRLPEKASPMGFLRFDGEGPVVPISAGSSMIIPVRLLGRAPYSLDMDNLSELVADMYPYICSCAESISPENKRKEGQ
jgi:hypothetical protein